MNKSSFITITTLAAAIGIGAAAATTSASASSSKTPLTSDNVTILQAIELAQQHRSGVVIEAEREIEDGMRVYEIELADSDGKSWQTLIDIDTGDVILNQHRRDDDHDDDDDHDQHERAERAAWLNKLNNGEFISAQTAITQAQTTLNGTAYSVELEEHKGNVIYEVKLRSTDDRRVEVDIDALAFKK